MDFETLKQIIVDTLSAEPDEVTLETELLNDLDADSLDAVELSMAIEEKCGKGIPSEALAKIVTVGDILDFLAK